MPKPPFSDVCATYAYHRSPPWKLHRSLGMAKKSISAHTTYRHDDGRYYNEYMGLTELWLIQDTGGQLEWVNIWHSDGPYTYSDLPWASDKKWPRLTPSK